MAERDQDGKITRFEYDALGRLVKVIDHGFHVTTYTYDELSNRITQTDAMGRTTRFEYDKAGRQIARILPDGKRETMTYDAAGNLKTWTDFVGRTTTFDYDINNRLLTKTFSTGRQVTYTYTATGRRLTATDTRGGTASTTTYSYDVRDRLTRIVQPGGDQLDFTYDANGNGLTVTTSVNGVARHTASYTYDDASRLDQVIDQLARVHDFEWDANGNRDRLAHPNGVAVDYTYNTLNRLTNLSAAGPSGVVLSQAFTLGPAGNRERIDENGGVSKSYVYDDLYRLTSENVTVAGALAYSRAWTYDAVGNRKQQVTAVGPAAPSSPNLQAGTIDYTYDARDRLLTEVFGGGPITNYTWDDNGNLITKSGEATYTWDEENRPIKVAKTDGTVVETAYDVDGNRVQASTALPGQTAKVTRFLVNTSSSLSHVVAELDVAADGTRTLQAVYVRGGDELLSVMRPDASSPSGWTTRFYTNDGINSARVLTDENGNVTDTYQLDAFGNLIARTGTDPQPYLFAGEPYDPNVGFAYHRARWMDPRVGAFASADPVLGNPFEPVTLHRYFYAGADPVNKVDPTGKTLSSMQVGAMMIMGIMVATAILQPRTFTDHVRVVMFGVSIGLAFSAAYWLYAAPAVTTGMIASAPLPAIKTGDVIIRQYKIGNEIIEVGGEVAVQGSHLIIRGLMVYARGKKQAHIGMQGVLQVRELLMMEARQLGFKTLEIFGHRSLGSTSANPGKEIHVVIDLATRG